jgi:glycosyl transferase family 25
MRSVRDIQNVFYINLEHRTDRRQMVIKEFEKLGWVNEPRWFKAVEMENGAIGCTISHIKCIELAKRMGLSHVVICEDDIKFSSPSTFTENLEKFLSSGIEWNVILLAGNNVGQYIDTGEGAVQIQMCQTTTGYIVKSDYYDTLINNFKEGLGKLIREPFNHSKYAIDKYWFYLQIIGKWFLIYPLTVTQQSVYSDIEKKVLNYDRLMLTLDKSSWFKRK